MTGQDEQLNLTQLRAALMNLVQLATARRLRRPEPPNAAEQCMSLLKQVLLAEIPITLSVQRTGILFDETNLLGEDMLSQNLCRALYDEGLRGLFVEPTVSTDELTKLIGLLSQDWESRASFETELVTAAWQAQFSAVHLDMQISGLEGEERLNDTELLEGLGRQLSMDEQIDLNPLLERLRDIDNPSWSSLGEEDESHVMLSSPREAEALHQELERVRHQQDVSMPQMSNIVMEVLRQTPSAEGVQAMTHNMLDMLLESCSAGRPDELNMLHAPLSLLEDGLFDDWTHRDVFVDELRGLSGATMWDAVLEGWKQNPEEQLWIGPLFTLASCTPPEEANQVIHHTARLPKRALRQAIADGLALVQTRNGHHPSVLLNNVTGDGWTVALLAMSRSKDATVISKILAQFNSPSAAIREAVLVAVRHHQSPRIKTIARNALDDPHPDVRMEALRYLAVYHDSEGGEIIMRTLANLPAGRHAKSELMAMTKALVVIRGAEAVDPLKSIALRENIELKSPNLVDAVLMGLFAAGRPGAAALDSIGISRPPLRPRIRTLLGS